MKNIHPREIHCMNSIWLQKRVLLQTTIVMLGVEYNLSTRRCQKWKIFDFHMRQSVTPHIVIKIGNNTCFKKIRQTIQQRFRVKLRYIVYFIAKMNYFHWKSFKGGIFLKLSYCGQLLIL